MKRKSTMIELVEELELLPDSPEIKEMIQEAKQGEYHDYKNKKYICGKMASSQKLHTLGYHELASRIESGEFDEPADDIDEQSMRKDLEANMSEGEAKAMKKILGL